MTSRDFVFWLQGFIELNELSEGNKYLNNTQFECVKRHLNLVFKHEIDPSYGDDKHQEELNDIHNPEADKKDIEKNVQNWIDKNFPEKDKLYRC